MDRLNSTVPPLNAPPPSKLPPPSEFEAGLQPSWGDNIVRMSWIVWDLIDSNLKRCSLCRKRLVLRHCLIRSDADILTAHRYTGWRRWERVYITKLEDVLG